MYTNCGLVSWHHVVLEVDTKISEELPPPSSGMKCIQGWAYIMFHVVSLLHLFVNYSVLYPRVIRWDFMWEWRTWESLQINRWLIFALKDGSNTFFFSLLQQFGLKVAEVCIPSPGFFIKLTLMKYLDIFPLTKNPTSWRYIYKLRLLSSLHSTTHYHFPVPCLRKHQFNHKANHFALNIQHLSFKLLICNILNINSKCWTRLLVEGLCYMLNN